MKLSAQAGVFHWTAAAIVPSYQYGKYPIAKEGKMKKVTEKQLDQKIRAGLWQLDYRSRTGFAHLFLPTQHKFMTVRLVGAA